MDQSPEHDAQQHDARGGIGRDNVARLIAAFEAREPTASAASKLDMLMDLERLDDPRIVPFLVGVLADESQPMEIRIHLVRRLRNGRLAPEVRLLVAPVLGRLLQRRQNRERVAAEGERHERLLDLLVSDPLIDEAAILATCNRVEVYVAAVDVETALDCASGHLATTTGLTSAELGRYWHARSR
ncbi:MAG TPA: hypothetical protein VF153_08210 [Candidatus Limnocylindria bacterium]